MWHRSPPQFVQFLIFSMVFFFFFPIPSSVALSIIEMFASPNSKVEAWLKRLQVRFGLVRVLISFLGYAVLGTYLLTNQILPIDHMSYVMIHLI